MTTTPIQSATVRGRGTVGNENSAASPRAKAAPYMTGAGATTPALSLEELADTMALSRSTNVYLLNVGSARESLAQHIGVGSGADSPAAISASNSPSPANRCIGRPVWPNAAANP